MSFIRRLAALATSAVILLSATPPALANDVSSPEATAGYWFGCGILRSGRAACWGANYLGQLGDGNWNTRSLTPVIPSGLGGNVVQVGSGAFHSCALKANGRMFCWGYNSRGQLGFGALGTGALTPVEVPLPRRAVSIAVGYEHTCAALRNGRVACWGWNANGQLGDGTRVDRIAPTLVPGLRNVVEVATHYRHTCALHANGTVSCWGANQAGQSSQGTNNLELTPVRMAGLRRVVEIGLGQDHSCARQVSGVVQCWGSNVFGTLGRATVNSAPNGPGRITGLSGVTRLAMGRHHSCAVDDAGDAWCWGLNDAGQIGTGQTPAPLQVIPLPTRVQGLGNARIVSMLAGWDHTCALAGNGVMRCWGANAHGQLGDGTTTQRLEPVRVQGAVFLVPTDGADAALR